MAFNNFVTGIKNLWNGTYDYYNDILVPGIISGKGLPFDIEKSERVATVFTCIKILSETLSRMPLNVYSDEGKGRTVDKTDYRYPILHYQPNNWTTQQTFISTLEVWRNLKGNSFARIYRDNRGKLLSLVLIPTNVVTGYKIVKDKLYYVVTTDKNEDEVVSADDILHFKGISKDGIWGLNPIEALRQSISASYSGINTIDNFYKNNAMSPRALKSTVSGANQKAMLEALEEYKTKYAGSENAGSTSVLPPNTEMVDMKLSFADAQFIETMKFNALTIASLYGIPSWMVGILEQTKYSSVETTSLEFKSMSLAAIGRMYRQELESKLLTIEERLSGKSIEFNWEALVEIDSKTRIENQRTLQNMGVITPNEVAKNEGYPTYPNGDQYFMPGNMLTVEKIVNATTTPKQQVK